MIGREKWTDRASFSLATEHHKRASHLDTISNDRLLAVVSNRIRKTYSVFFVFVVHAPESIAFFKTVMLAVLSISPVHLSEIKLSATPRLPGLHLRSARGFFKLDQP
jgi:hypothetical protein